MLNYFEEEIAIELKNEIESGIIKTHNGNQKYFDFIEQGFTIGFNRIDWEKNGFVFFAHLANKSDSDFERINLFFNFILREYPSFINETVYVVGDDRIDFVYEMKFNIFVEKYRLFFELPQHTYVIFKENNICVINYTFEGELYFGFASTPDGLPTGASPL